MSNPDSQEPGIMRDGKQTWILAIGVCLLIVLCFWAAAQVNTRIDKPWSTTAAGPGSSPMSGTAPPAP
jgi:hypothetical protein